tara:strand:- start:558 stop:809 length:252 start_codon:yes stop_codon:yes gene_type:complete
MTGDIKLEDNPLEWIASNISDDLAGVEGVVFNYTAEEILEPALGYIEAAFKDAEVPMPDRKLILTRIDALIEFEKHILGVQGD